MSDTAGPRGGILGRVMLAFEGEVLPARIAERLGAAPAAGMTLPVGLAALQGFFSSDARSIAAGVCMTIVPILIFFIFVQRYFVRGLSGAVKG